MLQNQLASNILSPKVVTFNHQLLYKHIQPLDKSDGSMSSIENVKIETIHLSGRLYYGVNQFIYAEVADSSGNPINFMAKHPYSSQILPVGRQAYPSKYPTIPCTIITAENELAIGLPVLKEALNSHTLLPRPFYQAIDGSRHWEAIDQAKQPIPNYVVDTISETVRPIGLPVYNAENEIIPNLIRLNDGSITEGITLQPHHLLFKNIALINQNSLEITSKKLSERNNSLFSKQKNNENTIQSQIRVDHSSNGPLMITKTEKESENIAEVIDDSSQNSNKVKETVALKEPENKQISQLPAPGYLLIDGSIAILAVKPDGTPIDGYGICPNTKVVLPVGKKATEATNHIFSCYTKGKMIEGLPIADSLWDEKTQQGILNYLTVNDSLVHMPINSEGKLLHGLAKDVDGIIKPVGFALSSYLEQFYKGHVLSPDGDTIPGIPVKSFTNINIKNLFAMLAKMQQTPNKPNIKAEQLNLDLENVKLPPAVYDYSSQFRVDKLMKQYTANSDQRSPNSQQNSLNPQQYSPNSQQYSPNSQQYSPNSQQYSPNSQQYSPNSQQYSPNSQQYSPNSQQYSPNAQQSSPNAQQYSPNAQQYLANTPPYSPNSQQYSPNLHQNSPNVQQMSINLQQTSPNFQKYQQNSLQYLTKPQNVSKMQHYAPISQKYLPDLHKNVPKLHYAPESVSKNYTPQEYVPQQQFIECIAQQQQQQQYKFQQDAHLKQQQFTPQQYVLQLQSQQQYMPEKFKDHQRTKAHEFKLNSPFEEEKVYKTTDCAQERICTYLDKPVPTVVGQQLEPILIESEETFSVHCKITEPKIIPVNIYVPKPVQSTLAYEGKGDDHHSTVTIPAAHFQTLLENMNPHLKHSDLKSLVLSNGPHCPLSNVAHVEPLTSEWNETFDSSKLYIDNPAKQQNKQIISNSCCLPSSGPIKAY